MLSDEEKEIFNNLKEYMQNKIDNGYHKFIYNDLDWDFKCIDCINAIDKVLKQSKEIEELKSITNSYNSYGGNLMNDTRIIICDSRYFLNGTFVNKFVSKDKIKAKIEEVSNGTYDAKIVLQSLLEKE